MAETVTVTYTGPGFAILAGKAIHHGETRTVPRNQFDEARRYHPHGFKVLGEELQTVSAETVQPERPVSEAARKLAEAAGIDLDQVEGTGKDGGVTKPDVERAIQALLDAEQPDEGEPVAERLSEPESEPDPDED